jgi:hypothetical protein
MSRIGNEFGGPAKERSGWLIPLAVFVITAALTSLFLAYYLYGPRLLGAEPPAPTDSVEPVALEVHGTGFHIPANYILFASARKGGSVEKLDMVALLPDLQGYTLGSADAFSSDESNSPVVSLSLGSNGLAISDGERLDRIYMPYITNPDGAQGPYGLTQYDFNADSGYRDQVLFVSATPTGQALFLCFKPSELVPAPTCLRTVPVAEHLSLTYRFKRLQLEHWNDIDTGIRALIGAFMDRT